MIRDTSQQYDKAIAKCKDIFIKKLKDYGASWRILRPSSITDQIMIKAQRIRSIQEKGTQKIKDGVYGEFMGIINYAVMALIQLEIGISTDGKDQAENLIYQYEKHVAAVKKLMQDKNHDYNEAWREMRISSITDLILVKLLRIKLKTIAVKL
jgi:hypothetical protein